MESIAKNNEHLGSSRSRGSASQKENMVVVPGKEHAGLLCATLWGRCISECSFLFLPQASVAAALLEFFTQCCILNIFSSLYSMNYVCVKEPI